MPDSTQAPIPFQQAQIVARAIASIPFDEWKAMDSESKEPFLMMARRAIRANRRYLERYAPDANVDGDAANRRESAPA